MAAKATYTPVKLTAAGNIRAAAGKLTSLIVANPTAAALACIVNDAITSTTGEVFQVSVVANDTKVLSFNPPLPFATGIRIGTLAAGLIVTGAFID